MTIIQLTKNHHALHRGFGYLIVDFFFLYTYLVRGASVFCGDEPCPTRETVCTILQRIFFFRPLRPIIPNNRELEEPQYF
ncbi:hypothetical protein L873DRAFT_344250 [Choiromyces venosus 120613-1]|uniref:Uncharacterized protein n=1 Tax=Choiromyces venosus 120613-1 TaxID=1336337 RepID=A0A3N4IYC9_9PEZI|nr:hypothetical protein L873DRAFT_344250 [Choiromyces venosus 120613-1]